MHKAVFNMELIVANLLFGLSYSFIVRMLENNLSCDALFVLQILTSALFIIPLALLNPKRRKVTAHSMSIIAMCGVVTLYGWSLLTLRGISESSTMVVASLSTLSPSVTIVAATISKAWINKPNRARHITRKQVRWVAAPLLLLLLVSLVILHDTPSISSLSSLSRNADIIIAVLCIGVSTVIIESHHEVYGTLTILAIYFAVAMLLMPLLLTNFPDSLSEAVEYGVNRGGAPISIITMTIPLYLLYRGALQLTPLHTALYRYIQPFIALLAIFITARHDPSDMHIVIIIKELLRTLSVTLALLLICSSLIPKRLLN